MADATELVQRLEQGVQEIMTSDGWRRYLTAQATFHDYSAGNVLLMLWQRPTASRVAGYTTWQRLGRQVRKDEHGIAILAPVFPRKEQLTKDGETEQSERGALAGEAPHERRQPVRFRVAYVFDISQTEGRELPAPLVHRLEGDSGQGHWLVDRLLALAKEEGLTVDMAATDTGSANGFYRPLTKEIHVALRLAPDQQTKTLAHEIGHHLLEHGRNRSPGRSAEEAEAEGVAFVVCSRFGLDTSQYSFGYVAAWSQQGKDAIATVKKVATTIQRTAAELIDRIEPTQDREQASARSTSPQVDRVSVGIER